VRVYVNPLRELLFVGVDQVPQGFTTPLFMNYSIKEKCVRNLSKTGNKY